jgi:hypothetical protein
MHPDRCIWLVRARHSQPSGRDEGASGAPQSPVCSTNAIIKDTMTRGDKLNENDVVVAKPTTLKARLIFNAKPTTR